MNDAINAPYVFDEGPLSHFSEAGWLSLLQLSLGGREAWLPETVRRELGEGVNAHPHLRQVLDASWLNLRILASKNEQDVFTEYTELLLGPNKENLGECGVLALAEVHGSIAVIDDRVARNIAVDRGVATKTTVALLCDLITAGHLGLDAASAVADNLLSTEYRLPFNPGGFKSFVRENDLVSEEHQGY